MEGTLLIDRASYSEIKERIFCKDDDGDRAVKQKGQRQRKSIEAEDWLKKKRIIVPCLKM